MENKKETAVEYTKMVVDVLSKTSMALEGFNFEPKFDENDEITSVKVSFSTSLVDIPENGKSALELIENNLIAENEKFHDLLLESISEEDYSLTEIEGEDKNEK